MDNKNHNSINSRKEGKEGKGQVKVGNLIKISSIIIKEDLIREGIRNLVVVKKGVNLINIELYLLKINSY